VTLFDSISHSDHLHQQPRFRPLYPHDNVVRFLMVSRSLLKKSPARFLEIGMGAGRHCKLAMEVGFEAFGLDPSLAGLQHAGEPAPIRNSSGSGARVDARTSRFEDRGVAAALSYGVFCDGTADEMKQAILEVNRVLISDSRRQGVFCPPYQRRLQGWQG
jgi:SAM-dependent methyltransferase